MLISIFFVNGMAFSSPASEIFHAFIPFFFFFSQASVSSTAHAVQQSGELSSQTYYGCGLSYNKLYVSFSSPF